MAILLSLLLGLLCGCARETPPPETFPDVTLLEVPPAQGLYDPDSSLEKATGGALRIYPTRNRDTTGIRALGETLLVFSGSERTTLTALQGDDLTPVGSIELDFLLNTRDPSLNLEDRVFSFYDPVKKQTVVLDETLREVRRIEAPDGLVGPPVLSGGQRTLFYATGKAIFAWDLEQDIHRCLKEISFPVQSVTGLYLEDTVLRFRIAEGSQIRTLFLSTATGRILSEKNGEVELQSRERTYAASLPWGLGELLVFGSGEEPQIFLPHSAGSTCFFLTHREGAVTYASPTPGQLLLEYYDLDTGLRRSVLTLETAEMPLAIADTKDGIYILISDPEYHCPTIYRWDTSRSGLSDQAQYTAPYITDPNTEDLAQCQSFARELSEKYGLRIQIGSEAAKIRPQGYTLDAETQPGIVMRELELLDERLSQYPEGLLRDTAAHFSALTLCIVRQASGPEPGTGLQFMEERDAYVVITAGAYSEPSLYHGLFQVMETHILTESAALDQWNDWNPQGFRYSYGPVPQVSGIYLEGENQAFVDALSMTFPREDRASIFQAAMVSGNAELFRSDAMHAKLRAICFGIRDAYGLKKYEGALLWEQYLDAPLASQK